MEQKQPKRSEREWIDLIRECRSSGLSDKAWCGEHGICASTIQDGRLFIGYKTKADKVYKIRYTSFSSLILSSCSSS